MIWDIFKIKNLENHRISRFLFDFISQLAEKEGFEPPDLLQSTVFKTAAFDRSAISPVCLLSFTDCECKYRMFF